MKKSIFSKYIKKCINIFLFNNVNVLIAGVEPRPTYMFLGNLALTDLITGIAVTVGKLYPSEKNNQFICAFKLGK